MLLPAIPSARRAPYAARDGPAPYASGARDGPAPYPSAARDGPALQGHSALRSHRYGVTLTACDTALTNRGSGLSANDPRDEATEEHEQLLAGLAILTDREHEDVYKPYEPQRPDGPGDDGVEDGSAMRYEEEQDIMRFDTGGGKGGRTDAAINAAAAAAASAAAAAAASSAAAAAAFAMARRQHGNLCC